MRKLLNVSNKTHSLYLPLIVEDYSIQVQIHRKFVKFFNSLVDSTNSTVRMCKLLIQNGSGSDVCKSLNYIRNQYHIHGEGEMQYKFQQLVMCVTLWRMIRLMLKILNAYYI